MGRFSVESETVFSHPREVVWDFATNPNNWGRMYKGSGGMANDVKVPLEIGMLWRHQMKLNLTKCAFGVTSKNFFGFFISQ